MRGHLDNADVQRGGCGVLYYLTQDPETRKCVAENGGIEVAYVSDTCHLVLRV